MKKLIQTLSVLNLLLAVNVVYSDSPLLTFQTAVDIPDRNVGLPIAQAAFLFITDPDDITEARAYYTAATGKSATETAKDLPNPPTNENEIAKRTVEVEKNKGLKIAQNLSKNAKVTDASLKAQMATLEAALTAL